MKSPRQMTDGELTYTRTDLSQVIQLQEESVQLVQARNASITAESICPKLGEYRDDLYAVCEEIERRKKKEKDSPAKVLRDVYKWLVQHQAQQGCTCASVPWDRVKKFMAKE